MHFVLYMACGEMIFIKKIHILEKKKFLFYFIEFFNVNTAP